MAADEQPRREHIKDLFSLHAGERRGFLLMMAGLAAAVVLVVYVKFIYEPPEPDLAHLEQGMREWVASQAVREADTKGLPEPFPFDPNTTERKEWLALGLSDRQVDGLERYMAKGGRFRTKKDLGRMYSIRPDQFARLAPFILLPDSLPAGGAQRREARGTTVPSMAVVAPAAAPTSVARPMIHRPEVNTADSATLVAVRGIGPSFARGIIKYRDMLGGFVSLDQLAEVYVLRDKPDAVERLRSALDLDLAAVRRIPLNTCTVEELAGHPYVRWKIARPLIAYREQHGPFADVAAIKGCHVVTDSLYARLAAYLTVD